MYLLRVIVWGWGAIMALLVLGELMDYRAVFRRRFVRRQYGENKTGEGARSAAQEGGQGGGQTQFGGEGSDAEETRGFRYGGSFGR